METITTELAYAKLTRTLHITGVRDDGYHLLSSEMVTVDLADTLEFAPGSGLTIRDAIDWTPKSESMTGGFSVPTDGTNLVSRALVLCGYDFAISLTKRIPAGAGLGGGSADAAAVLRHVGFDDADKAATLGADVPFCIAGGRAQVTGVGESVEQLAYDERSFVIVTPSFGVDTAAVYRAYDEMGAKGNAHEMNDLTFAAFRVEPRLVGWRELIGEATGGEPVLAGSGSSLFIECEERERDLLAQQVITRVNERNERALVSPVTTMRGSGQ
jgi:4-diphosphocytidyl-2-C-methyl-D-erythritol kinase